MSVIGLDTILPLITSDNIIENLGGRELLNPEGIGLDLRLGSIHSIEKGGAFIECDGAEGLGLRKGVETKEICVFNPAKEQQEYITIKPGEYFLVQTYETVNVPSNVLPHVYPRTSLFRAGLLLLVGKPDPGYSGKLTFGLTNLSSFEVKLQMGARICNIIFFEIKGKSTQYRGQHQGGRVSPHKVEKQV